NWVYQSIKATKEMKKQAEKISIPVLLLQAEVDHSVKQKDQVKFSSLCKTCTIKEIKGSKHEIMFSKDEVNKEFWSEIFKFLED
ncbi:serine aminopeptidase domain-containing protein, partial [Bullifex sp.]|uniref:serine aminopeptidase domain-containing protein n=1 Tax=Bullifex sp. TaxID=2815808 RepID=UPI002A805093